MLSDAEVNEICDRLFSVSANEWADTFNLSGSDCARAERECDHRASYYAFISGYLAARGGNGCGDCGHVEAYRVGHKRMLEVRKLLGYPG